MGAPARWALEIRAQWAEAIRDGRKKMEVRTYALPDEALGQPVLLVTPPEDAPMFSPEGRPIPGLPTEVAESHSGAHVVAEVTFDSVKPYTSQEAFAADQCLHGIPTDSPYSWKAGVTTICYGWHIASVAWRQEPAATPHMIRRVNSLFSIIDP